ncbi:MAG: hypothetical protein ACUVQ0_03295 [Thermoproteota archaeon]
MVMQQIIHAFNARILLVPKEEGMNMAVRKAREIAEKTGGFFLN